MLIRRTACHLEPEVRVSRSVLLIERRLILLPFPWPASELAHVILYRENAWSYQAGCTSSVVDPDPIHAFVGVKVLAPILVETTAWLSAAAHFG